jgi:hypothetical protein
LPLVTVAVTVSRRATGTVGRRSIPGGRIKARAMFDNGAIKLGVNAVSRFAYGAGIAGILANLSLIAMYALLGLQAGSPEDGTLPGSAFHLTGSANDLLGSLSTALMIPVALSLGKRLPRRRAARLV